MKKYRFSITVMLVFCFILTSMLGFTFMMNNVSAQEITTVSQAKKLAKKVVKGATVLEAEQDDDDGILVYEVQLVKGKKEYDLVYRASDSKLISYSWEIQSGYVKKGKGRIISKKKCKKLAKKKVSGGKITHVLRKRSDGIDYYKVNMRKGSKKYEMEIHARTGKLLEYEWELVAKN